MRDSKALNKNYYKQTSVSENTYAVVKNLLNELGIYVPDKNISNTLAEHPYPRSIESIKEALYEWGVKSKAYRISGENLPDINYPSIAHISKNGGYYLLLLEYRNGNILYLDPANSICSETIEAYCNKWDGVVLVPTSTQKNFNTSLKSTLATERLEKLRGISIVFFLLSALILVVVYAIQYIHSAYVLSWSILLSLKITGTFIVYEIQKIELGINEDQVLKKICHLHKSVNCGAIINSPASKIFNILSWGDIGLIYFLGGLLGISIFTFQQDLRSAFNYYMIVNYLALPFSLYSLFYQYKIAKYWCPLCVSVVMILWIEFFLFYYESSTSRFLADFSIKSFFSFTWGYIIVTLCWIIFKKSMWGAFRNKNFKTEINKIKKDKKLFDCQLNCSENIPQLSVSKELTLGNFEADNILIIVVRPGCPACILALRKVKEFLELYPSKVSVIFRFYGDETKESEVNQVIDQVLALVIEDREKYAISTLENWYGPSTKIIRKWRKQQSPAKHENIMKAEKLRKAYKAWCMSAGISVSPTFLLNGRLVPIHYSIDNLIYFLKRK